MIAGITGKNHPLFRGKDCSFWGNKIFHGNDFDGLLVFNPHAFPDIGPGGIEELITRIKQIDQLSSLEGTPFIAIPKRIVDEENWDPGEPGLFDRLKEKKEMNRIHLENRFNVLDPGTDFRAIEASVIDYQVAELMKNGVTVEDYGNFYIEGMPPVGEGTSIAAGVVLKGDCEIGKNVTLYPNAYLENAKIGDNCTVLPGCVIRDSALEKDAQIGPYTHLRNGALVKEGAKMGNFVEMKKSILGKGSKAMHLTYIGDADVGEKVNIGAGTITCNYDGVNKNKTIIEDNVFIGSGTELVAPVAVRKNGYVAAGSTITEEIPEDSLGVARERQRNIIDWVKRKRSKAKLKKCNV